MTGAAGGLAGGLWAAFGARARARRAVRPRRARTSTRACAPPRAVIVGEGRLDEQTLQGKALGEVATRARQAGVPCYADRRHATRWTRSARGSSTCSACSRRRRSRRSRLPPRAWRTTCRRAVRLRSAARRGRDAARGPSFHLPGPRGRRAVVIGAGSFGTAVAVLLARGGLRTTLQARTAEQAERLNADRENQVVPARRRAAARAADRAGRAPGSTARTTCSSASPRAASTR